MKTLEDEAVAMIAELLGAKRPPSGNPWNAPPPEMRAALRAELYRASDEAHRADMALYDQLKAADA